MSRADISRAYEAWKKSKMTCLEDAYKAPSEAKQRAWIRCIGICRAYNGRDLRIIGHNINTFSAGFTYVKYGALVFVWITKDNVRQIVVEEDYNG